MRSQISGEMRNVGRRQRDLQNLQQIASRRQDRESLQGVQALISAQEA